ncbi:MAG TPA: hypothetical protein V6C65_09210 [Allocoleopsis sp.]
MKTTARYISPLHKQTVLWNDTAFVVHLTPQAVILSKRFDPARDIVYLSCAGYWPNIKLLGTSDHRVYQLNDCFIRITSNDKELTLMVEGRAIEVI